MMLCRLLKTALKTKVNTKKVNKLDNHLVFLKIKTIYTDMKSPPKSLKSFEREYFSIKKAIMYRGIPKYKSKSSFLNFMWGSLEF